MAHSLPRNVSHAWIESSATSMRRGRKPSVLQCTSARYEPGVTLWKTKVLRDEMGAEKEAPRVESVACVDGGREKGFGTAGRYSVIEVAAARGAMVRVERRIAGFCAVG